MRWIWMWPLSLAPGRPPALSPADPQAHDTTSEWAQHAQETPPPQLQTHRGITLVTTDTQEHIYIHAWTPYLFPDLSQYILHKNKKDGEGGVVSPSWKERLISYSSPIKQCPPFPGVQGLETCLRVGHDRFLIIRFSKTLRKTKTFMKSPWNETLFF